MNIYYGIVYKGNNASSEDFLKRVTSFIVHQSHAIFLATELFTVKVSKLKWWDMTKSHTHNLQGTVLIQVGSGWINYWDTMLLNFGIWF